MSDFHEMATHLRLQEERSLLMEIHGYMVATDCRRSGFEKRRFSYSDHLKDKIANIDLIILPERKTDKNSDA